VKKYPKLYVAHSVFCQNILPRKRLIWAIFVIKKTAQSKKWSKGRKFALVTLIGKITRFKVKQKKIFLLKLPFTYPVSTLKNVALKGGLWKDSA
jgi:hypothetical protein